VVIRLPAIRHRDWAHMAARIFRTRNGSSTAADCWRGKPIAAIQGRLFAQTDDPSAHAPLPDGRGSSGGFVIVRLTIAASTKPT
jgi:hypothetical protein